MKKILETKNISQKKILFLFLPIQILGTDARPVRLQSSALIGNPTFLSISSSITNYCKKSTNK